MELNLTVLLLHLLLSTGLPETNVSLNRAEYSHDHQITKFELNHSNISQACPPWSYTSPPDHQGCECPKYSGNILQCKRNASSLFVLGCNCATYSREKNMIEFGKCQYTCVHFNGMKSSSPYMVYHKLPRNLSKWNSYMCGSRARSGSLCGKCAKGYLPRCIPLNRIASSVRWVHQSGGSTF